MKEILKEIIASINQHRTRSILTGFGITWGMFILIVLLGAGNGFRSGILKMFSGYASNSIWVTGHQTSETSAEGLQSGAKIRFNEDIILKLKKRFPQIQLISSEINLENPGAITYMDNSGNFSIKGIEQDYMAIKLLEVDKGRFFNHLDYQGQRQVVIIGKRVKDMLFKNEEPLGKSINISGAFFQVVGVLKEGTIFSMMEQNNIYAPYVTLINVYNLDREYNTFGTLLHRNTPIESLENDLRSFLSKEIGFNKQDKNAIFVNNIQLQVKAFNTLFDGLNSFLWVLGLCFLLSGMIGVTNIMLVVVKERTIEIGIRKALGATPNSIIQLVIMESLIITCLFGIIGLLLGYAGLFCYNWIISALQTGQMAVFEKGHIELYISLIVFVMLIISGVIAGIFPAKKAAEIMPIETLNKAG